MREYILTKTERKILETYVEKGIKLQDFRVLIHRIKKSHQQLEADLKLIETALNKES
jgi:hypothetical protein